jgi:glutathione S-transferase
MLTLHDYLLSGNGYKVRLLLHQLGIPFRRVEHDILNGATRTAGFLAMNPTGKIPVLQLEDGTVVAESGAILYFLAHDSDMWPSDRLEQAHTLQWLFFEQYSHEPCVAVARFIQRLNPGCGRQTELPVLRAKGEAALGIMEAHLAQRRFFVDDRYGIADIALYAYTHVAEEGGFDLDSFPSIRRWLAEVASQPGHVPIEWSPG